MANNVGYLTSSKTPEHQEMYTPYYAVDPIVKYIPRHYKIWCPFDEKWSAFLHISVKQHGRPGRTACHSAFNGVGR